MRTSIAQRVGTGAGWFNPSLMSGALSNYGSTRAVVHWQRGKAHST